MKTPRIATRFAVAIACSGAFAVLPAHATDTGKAGTAAAANKPAPVKVSAKELQEFHKVIDPLLKEGAEAFQPKDPKNPGKLREKPDFFEGGKLPEGLTQDVVLEGLKQQQSPDVRIDAYAKWQVLSGLPNPVPDDLQARWIEVYRAAPKPPNHPGLNHQELQNDLNKFGTKDRKAVEPISEKLEQMDAQYQTNVDPVIKYRNELMARLPTNQQTLLAEWEDLYFRVQASTESKQLYDRLEQKTKVWSASAKPQEIAALVPALDAVGKAAKNDKYKAYFRVQWMEPTAGGGGSGGGGGKKGGSYSGNAKPSGLQFDGRPAFDPKYFDNFFTDMKDAARGGGGNPALTGETKMDTKKKS